MMVELHKVNIIIRLRERNDIDDKLLQNEELRKLPRRSLGASALTVELVPEMGFKLGSDKPLGVIEPLCGSEFFKPSAFHLRTFFMVSLFPSALSGIFRSMNHQGLQLIEKS